MLKYFIKLTTIKVNLHILFAYTQYFTLFSPVIAIII